jgi:hypothetical protein
MMGILRSVLAFTLAAALAPSFLRAAEFVEAPKSIPALPAISAPLSFPTATAPEFFAGAQRIVDLGGEPISPWTKDLSRANPQARIEEVNIKPLEEITQRVSETYGLSNLHGSSYDFFAPPPDHPTGDRVIMNSPNFGGLETEKDVERFVDMIDAHLEPGGHFYAHADDLWLTSMSEMRLSALLTVMGQDAGPAISQKVADRHAMVLEALKKRFGAANVSQGRLSAYDPRGQLDVRTPEYALQVRKPR